MKKWYANVYILLTILISLVAVSMAALMLLLLPQSSEIVRFMQWRMARAKSFRVDVLADYDGRREQRDSRNVPYRADEAVSLEFDGRIDRSDTSVSKLQGTFAASFGAQEPTTDLAGETVRIGRVDYMRFDALPPSIGAIPLDDFRGVWLVFDAAGFRDRLNLPFLGGEAEPLAEDEIAGLLEQFRTTPFLRVEERLKSETLGGVSTHHYKVRPEMLFFKDYFIRVQTARLGRELTNKERLLVDTFFANVAAEDGELWIGKRDYFLYRMRLRFRFDDGSREGVLSVTADFSRFNEPAAIEAPAGARDVSEILESLAWGLTRRLPLAKDGAARRGDIGESRSGLAVDTVTAGQADPDKDGLSDELEYFYRTDPNDPDTDGDGMRDGEEIELGRNPSGSGNLFDFGVSGQ